MRAPKSSPFISRDGTDLYESSNALYYFLQIVLWLYALGYVANLVLVMNTSVTHTYFKTLPGGALFTERYVTARWIFLMLALLRILVPICVLSMVLYRRSLGCLIGWLVVLVLLVIVDVLVLIALGTDYGGCNGQNEFGNLCNAPLWCCVPEIYGNPANMCLNSVGCTPAVALEDLRPNTDFLWLFWVTFVFVVFDVVLLMVPVIIWLGQPLQRLDFRYEVEPATTTTRNKDEESMIRAPMSPPPPSSSSGAQKKGVRRRNHAPPSNGGGGGGERRARLPTRRLQALKMPLSTHAVMKAPPSRHGVLSSSPPVASITHIPHRGEAGSK